jgi:hypothetical protein
MALNTETHLSKLVPSLSLSLSLFLFTGLFIGAEQVNPHDSERRMATNGGGAGYTCTSSNNLPCQVPCTLLH